jgi:hypothetical protein
MSDREVIAPLGRQAGMTLVEIIVAFVVVSMTFAMVAGAFRLLARSGATGSELIERHDMLTRGIDSLRRDIERLERVAIGRDAAAADFVFAGDARTLAMVVMEPPFPTLAGFFLVRYAIVAREGGSMIVRSRAPFSASLVRPSPQFADDVTVLEGAYDFGFSYLERRDGRERWVARWSDRNILPVLVRLDVVDAVTGAAALPPLIFRPRADAEHGCARSGSGPCTIQQRSGEAAPAKEKPK